MRQGGQRGGSTTQGGDLDGVGGAGALRSILDVGVADGDVTHRAVGAYRGAAVELGAGEDNIAVDAEEGLGGGVGGEGERQGRAVGIEVHRVGDGIVAIGDAAGVGVVVLVLPAGHMVQVGGVGHDGHRGAVVHDIGVGGSAAGDAGGNGLQGHRAPAGLVLGEGEDGLGGEGGGGGKVAAEGVALLDGGIAVEGCLSVPVHEVVRSVGRGLDGDAGTGHGGIGAARHEGAEAVGQGLHGHRAALVIGEGEGVGSQEGEGEPDAVVGHQAAVVDHVDDGGAGAVDAVVVMIVVADHGAVGGAVAEVGAFVEAGGRELGTHKGVDQVDGVGLKAVVGGDDGAVGDGAAVVGPGQLGAVLGEGGADGLIGGHAAEAGGAVGTGNHVGAPALEVVVHGGRSLQGDVGAIVYIICISAGDGGHVGSRHDDGEGAAGGGGEGEEGFGGEGGRENDVDVMDGGVEGDGGVAAVGVAAEGGEVVGTVGRGGDADAGAFHDGVAVAVSGDDAGGEHLGVGAGRHVAVEGEGAALTGIQGEGMRRDIDGVEGGVADDGHRPRVVAVAVAPSDEGVAVISGGGKREGCGALEEEDGVAGAGVAPAAGDIALVSAGAAHGDMVADTYAVVVLHRQLQVIVRHAGQRPRPVAVTGRQLNVGSAGECALRHGFRSSEEHQCQKRQKSCFYIFHCLAVF